MKRIIILLLISCSVLHYSCGKNTEPIPEQPTTPTTPVNGNGGTTPTNSYIVKTIGISRIDVSVDDNFKIKFADLYGGGNRIILKAGTNQKMEMLSPSIGVLPDAFDNPDATMPYTDQPIDNGNPPTDTTGTLTTIIKLKGFDKSKTGYNQLNVVVSKFVWVMPPRDAGFRTNLTYLKIKKRSGSKNSEYGTDFIKGLFKGNITASTIEIAEPKANNPYITEDKIISSGIAVCDLASGKSLKVDLATVFYRTLYTANQGINVGSPLKFEWVNANNGTVKKFDDYQFDLTFSNIKTGGLDQIVEPADSVDKVFLRITGFNPVLTGFNQLRLFVANDGYYDGALQVIYNAKPLTIPTLASIKELYRAQGLFCQQLSPNFAHY